MTAVLQRQLFVLPAAALAAVVFGAALAVAPAMAVGAVGLGLVVALAFAFPVAHLALLIVMTLIVPYSLQNQVGTGAGLIPADVLLLVGLGRAVIVLAQMRLTKLHAAFGALTLIFLGLSAIQFWHGAFAEGHGFSEAGDELRELLGFGVVLVALPILLDERARGRLLKALLGVGLVLGLWGLAQWFLDLPYAEAGDFGVRSGVRLTSDGRGQLQGGLYGFPVAVIVGFAALLSGQLRGWGRSLVITVIGINGICLLLTFERTFWVVTILACCLVVVRAGRVQRLRAVLLAPLAAILIFVPVAVLSPASLSTARERFISIGQYGSDDSVRERVRESRQTIEEIRVHPLAGSGLGAAIWWGRPEIQVPPRLHWFVHNGYLHLAWKLGIPMAIFLVIGLVVPIARVLLRPRGMTEFTVFGAVVSGAAAALVALLIASITFPAVRARPITPTMGMLLAVCLVSTSVRPPAAPPLPDRR